MTRGCADRRRPASAGGIPSWRGMAAGAESRISSRALPTGTVQCEWPTPWPHPDGGEALGSPGIYPLAWDSALERWFPGGGNPSRTTEMVRLDGRGTWRISDGFGIRAVSSCGGAARSVPSGAPWHGSEPSKTVRVGTNRPNGQRITGELLDLGVPTPGRIRAPFGRRRGKAVRMRFRAASSGGGVIRAGGRKIDPSRFRTAESLRSRERISPSDRAPLSFDSVGRGTFNALDR